MRPAVVLAIDLSRAVQDKLAANGREYPVVQARGNATKYTELRVPEDTG